MALVLKVHCYPNTQFRPVTTVMTRYTPTSASGLQDE
jgi:hypothetical protein